MNASHCGQRALVLLLTAWMLGCSGGGGGGSVEPVVSTPTVPVQGKAYLYQPANQGSDGSCGNLETAIEAQAVARLEEQSRWMQAWSSYPYAYAANDAMSTNSGSASSASAATPASTTNTQVAGVDEPDWVKNTSEQVWVLDGSRLSQVAVAADGGLRLIGQADSNAHGLLQRDANRLWALGYENQVMVAQPSVDAAATMICPWNYGTGCGRDLDTTLQTFDVRADAAPSLASTSKLPGTLLAARLQAQSLRVITRARFEWPSSVTWWDNAVSQASSESARAKAAQAWLAAQTANVRATTLQQWLKPILLDDEAVTEAVCQSVTLANTPGALSWMIISTVDRTTGAITRMPVLADGDLVALNNGVMTIASRYGYSPMPANDVNHTTYHQFEVIDGQAPRYLASGIFEGAPLSSFSIDTQADGSTLVAVQTEKWPAWGTWTPIERASYILRLKASGRELVADGRSEALGKGQTLQSVRFVNHRAYAVTFRQIDPFYVIDTDARPNPVVLGELEIPGFSTYLHPISDNLILGLGWALDANGLGERKVKASLFDVSVASAPREQTSLVLSQGYAYSEALADYRAMTFAPWLNLALLPMQSWSLSGGSTSELRVLEVTPAGSLRELGALRTADPFAYFGRGVAIGDKVLAVGRNTIMSARAATPGVTVGRVGW